MIAVQYNDDIYNNTKYIILGSNVKSIPSKHVRTKSSSIVSIFTICQPFIYGEFVIITSKLVFICDSPIIICTHKHLIEIIRWE